MLLAGLWEVQTKKVADSCINKCRLITDEVLVMSNQYALNSMKGSMSFLDLITNINNGACAGV